MSESYPDAVHYAIVYVCVISASFLRVVYEIPFFAIPLFIISSAGAYVIVIYTRKLKAVKLEFEQADLDVFRAMCNAVEGDPPLPPSPPKPLFLQPYVILFVSQESKSYDLPTVAPQR